MLRIRLPYPDRSLNPNVRRVWRASLTPKREAREEGYFAAWGADDNLAQTKVFAPDKDKPLGLRIAIHPPDNRRRDLDNIVSAIKSYQDGIFDYLGMDDSQITRKEIVMRRSCPEGKVRYILYQK